MNSPSEIIRRLEAREAVPDHEFDRIYNSTLRELARVHFTPVSIARRAAELLVSSEGDRILDVGSGAGKFCLVGAATTRGHFVGVEQRENLLMSAQNIARQFHWPRVEFIHGSAFDFDWSTFDGFYLFNPFIEHLFKAIRMDDQVEPGLDAFEFRVQQTEEKLRELRVGAKVALLEGFGGTMPESFRLQSEEACGNGKLEIWVKQL